MYCCFSNEFFDKLERLYKMTPSGLGPCYSEEKSRNLFEASSGTNKIEQENNENKNQVRNETFPAQR